MPWSRAFEDPIPLPGRKPFLTLRDAARYVMALPAKDGRHRGTADGGRGTRANDVRAHWRDAGIEPKP